MKRHDTDIFFAPFAVAQPDALRPEVVGPVIDAMIERCDHALDQVGRPDAPADHRWLSETLDVPFQELSDAWGVVRHLQAVVDTPSLRAALEGSQHKVVALYSRAHSNPALHALYKRIDQQQGEQLSEPQRKALRDTLRDCRLAGAELAPDHKARFVATEQHSAALSQTFSNHVLDATDAFVCFATAQQMTGVPADVLESLGRDAREAGRDGEYRYRLSLHAPCAGPVLRYCEDRALREKIYFALTTRASEFGPAELDNTPLVTEILALRHERAALLGHAHFAEVSLIPKMADSPTQVMEFLRDLGVRSKPHACGDLEALRAFAREHLGLPSLEAWDLPFASERLRQSRYAFSEQEVKQHFTLDRVLQGLLEVCEVAFDVRIVADARPAWHPSVAAYRVERDGELMGHFFLDPYARPGKRGGAWMDGARPRWRKPGGELRTALAHVVTNFAPPSGDSPALLSHADVVTLFHEFGHALHFLLSRVDVLGTSGISGVEWDAIELPSQLMENFAWEWAVIQRISAHVDTGARLPRALFDKMLAARNFQSGVQMLRQVELALFDLRVHAEPGSGSDAQRVFDEVRSEMSVMPTPPFNRFQNGFSHIFAGGYAAGYYSYLWAEVLSADAWGEFERAGALDPATGRRFSEAILERGGSRSMREGFAEFVGRQPRIDALLRQRGMVTEH